MVNKGFATKIDSEYVSNYPFTYPSIIYPFIVFLSLSSSIYALIVRSSFKFHDFFKSKNTHLKFASSAQCVLVRQIKITTYFQRLFEKQAHIRKWYHNKQSGMTSNMSIPKINGVLLLHLTFYCFGRSQQSFCKG